MKNTYFTVLAVDHDDDGFVWADVSCPEKHTLAMATGRPGDSVRCYKCEQSHPAEIAALTNG